VRRTLQAAYAVYLLCVGFLVFTPGGAAPGGIIARIHELLSALSSSQLEVGLNVLMFVPLSLLGWFLFDRRSLPFWLVTGVLASAFIELVQLAIPGRVSTVQDVVANTTGAVIGAVLALVFGAWGTRSR
jgi:glycopeptide antibiotics resistance protein